MNHREASTQQWRITGDRATVQEIDSGSLQRIADATEKMAASYDRVREERDRYEGYYTSQRDRANRLELRIRALRGVITRLKRAPRP